MNSGTRSIGLISQTRRTTRAARTPRGAERSVTRIADEAKDVRHDPGELPRTDPARSDQPEEQEQDEPRRRPARR